MSQKHPPLKDTQERNIEITLFRYSLIGTQLFDPLTAGRLEQALRARTYGDSSFQPHLGESVSILRRILQLYNLGYHES